MKSFRQVWKERSFTQKWLIVAASTGTALPVAASIELSLFERLYVMAVCDFLRKMAGMLPEARLISFCSDVIVPQDIIASMKGGCFNFHSGPPERPGYRPYAFALADGDTAFGVTFHRMTAAVDAGTILRGPAFSHRSVQHRGRIKCARLRAAPDPGGGACARDPGKNASGYRLAATHGGHCGAPAGRIWPCGLTHKEGVVHLSCVAHATL